MGTHSDYGILLRYPGTDRLAVETAQANKLVQEAESQIPRLWTVPSRVTFLWRTDLVDAANQATKTAACNDSDLKAAGLVSASPQELLFHAAGGALSYKVNHRPHVAVRATPSTQGCILTSAGFGEHIDTFGWDI